MESSAWDLIGSVRPLVCLSFLCPAGCTHLSPPAYAPEKRCASCGAPANHTYPSNPTPNSKCGDIKEATGYGEGGPTCPG